jgi:hypothetical protein
LQRIYIFLEQLRGEDQSTIGKAPPKKKREISSIESIRFTRGRLSV